MRCRGICRLSAYKSQESLLRESIDKILVKVALNHQQMGLHPNCAQGHISHFK